MIVGAIIVISILFFGVFGTSYYAEMLEEYQCDTGYYSNAEIYDMLEVCYEDYNSYGLTNFCDLTLENTLFTITDYMDNNDDYVGTYVYMNGTVVTNTGNIVEIVDNINFAEELQNEILAYAYGDIGALQYGADVSLLGDIDANAFMPGDYVEVVGMYCGKIRLNNGAYTPAIIAVDIYAESPYSGY